MVRLQIEFPGERAGWDVSTLMINANDYKSQAPAHCVPASEGFFVLVIGEPVLSGIPGAVLQDYPLLSAGFTFFFFWFIHHAF